jgi:hypothetical protein
VISARRKNMKAVLGQFSCPFAPWRPVDGRVFDSFALDTETTDIDDERPYLSPAYVLGAACDGQRGFFISRDNVLPFFEAHKEAEVIMHNAPFDLKVLDMPLKPAIDIYTAVEADRVTDTMILKRLLSLATVGHTARAECGLADCALAHLGVSLQKEQTDAQGKQVRTSFGQFLGKPPSAIPAQYLTYLAQDVLATWHLQPALLKGIYGALGSRQTAFGYVNDQWLRDVYLRFGPLTHHIQLRASILMDVLRCNGIGVDLARREEKRGRVQVLLEECKERLRRRGFLVDQPGSGKALQSILQQFHRDHPDVELKRTESGERWSTAEEDLSQLACKDDFFADYARYRAAEKLLSTYLRKMGQPRLHPRFGFLMETGRTSCSGFNLQNLPREKDEKSISNTIRGCFVPHDGHIFIDSDYSQIELVVLAYACEKQLGVASRLGQLINGGQDVHRLIGAAVLGKAAGDVTKEERNSAKPVSFGRPGGMGVRGLQQVARSGYGVELSEGEVQKRIDAYHRLCPELDRLLKDEVDACGVIANKLDLTPAGHHWVTGDYFDPTVSWHFRSASYLGGMLLKVLREKDPKTLQGRVYSAEEINFFWEKAQQLPVQLKPKLKAKLQSQTPDRELSEAVRDWAGRRPVFTVTGRLRANATFCSSRNCLFQGVAADGAILGLWLVWRKGYKLVDFVHDQLVVESPADNQVQDRVAEIEELMKKGMLEVVPGMAVKVETVVTRSLNKMDLDPRYLCK